MGGRRDRTKTMDSRSPTKSLGDRLRGNDGSRLVWSPALFYHSRENGNPDSTRSRGIGWSRVTMADTLGSASGKLRRGQADMDTLD